MPGVIVSSIPKTSVLIAAANNNATLLQAGASTLIGLCLTNANAAPRYIKIYDKATAPAPASDSSLVVAEFVIPAGGTLQVFPNLPVTLGLGFAVVGGIPLNDNTSVSANDVIGTLFYL